MRARGWEDRLALELAAGLGRRWEWGSHDCVTFAWRCARAILDGPTPWDAWAAGWSDARSAARARSAVGGLVAALDRGADRWPVAYAQRGDIVAVIVDGAGLPAEIGRPALGVVEGAAAAFAAKIGLSRLPLSVAFASWPVGR